MSEDRLDEILQRLEALEARLDEGPALGPATDPNDPLPDRPDPDEKRFVDLVVDLVGERVAQILKENSTEPVDPRLLADLTATAVLDRVWSDGGGGGGDDRDRGDRDSRDRGPRDRGPRDRGPRDRDQGGRGRQSRDPFDRGPRRRRD